MGRLQTLLEDLHGRLQTFLAQNRLDFLDGFFPGRLGFDVLAFDLARRAGALQVRHDVGGDPRPCGRIGKRRAVMEAQLDDARQALNQKREVDFHFAHGQLGVEVLETFPDHPLAIEPERRLRQARLQFHQQVGVFALIETVLIELELFQRQAAQHGDLLGVALGHRVDGHPQQRTVQAQGAQVGGLLLQPPGTQWAGALLLGAQGFVRVSLVVDRRAGVSNWLAACLTCATAAPTTPGPAGCRRRAGSWSSGGGRSAAAAARHRPDVQYTPPRVRPGARRAAGTSATAL